MYGVKIKILLLFIIIIYVLGKTNDEINNRYNLTFFIAVLSIKTSVAHKI